MIFSKKKKVLSAMLSLAMIGTMVASVPFTASADTTTATPEVGVSYSTQIQSIGWQGAVADGALSGTVGKAKRLEAIKINLTNAPKGASITYKTQVQSFGWQSAVSDGAVSGTVGKAKRLETIKITLSGMPGYSVKYQVQGQSYGWQAAVSTENGTAIDSAASAGTVGQAKRLEAIKISIVKDPVTTVTVSSVAAINATTIEATLTRAATAAEQTATKFAVTRTDSNANVSTITMTPTFSTDGTKVDLTTGGNLMAGTYAVTATAGVTGTGTVAVKDRYVASIKLTSSKMVLDTSDSTNKSATVSYKAFDQYGTDITTNALANAITWTSSVGTATSVGHLGTVEITKTVNAFAYGDTGSLTGINSSSAASVTASLTYASYTTVASIAFGTPVLPTGYSAVTAKLTQAATIPITVTDDEGNVITSSTALKNDLVVSTSDSTINTNTNDGSGYCTKFSTDANDNATFTLDTDGVTAAETVTINFMVRSTGKLFTTTVPIVLTAEPYSVSFGSFNSTVSLGDSSLTLPIVVTDQFGNTMSASDVAAAATKLTIISSNTSVLSGSNDLSTDHNNLMISRSGSTKGNVVLTSGDIVGKNAVKTAALTTTVTVYVSSTGKSATLTLTAQPQRYPSTLTLASDFTTNMIAGSTYSFASDYLDQFGSALTDNIGDASISGYSVYAHLTLISGTAGDLVLNNDNTEVACDTAQSTSTKAFTLTSLPNVTATYKLAVQLVKAGTPATVYSEVDKTINVVANNVSGLTYTMGTIPTLSGADTYAYSDPYAREISVAAKTATGTSYAVPTSSIYNVTSSDTTVAKVLPDGSGDWYVAGANLDSTYTNFTGTKTATITAYVGTDDGTQTFTQTVTVSSDAPTTQSVVLRTKAVSTDKLTLNGDPVTDINLSSVSDSLTSVYAYALDQYGVYTELGASSNVYFTAADSTKYTGLDANNDAYKLNGHSFSLVSNVSPLNASKDLYATLFYKDGSGVVIGTGASVTVNFTAVADVTAPKNAILAQFTMAASTATAATSSAEVGATWKIVAHGAASTATAVKTGTVGASGAISATGLSASTSYDLYIIDAAGNASTVLTLTTTA